ncbi:hypothetical protein AO262_21155 [Pseudomonas fluorescens ABAC62]|nr:hypothetical protein AO262_21155 [Pseudomonas fluorescens ABAC62]
MRRIFETFVMPVALEVRRLPVFVEELWHLRRPRFSTRFFLPQRVQTFYNRMPQLMTGERFIEVVQ